MTDQPPNDQTPTGGTQDGGPKIGVRHPDRYPRSKPPRRSVDIPHPPSRIRQEPAPQEPRPQRMMDLALTQSSVPVTGKQKQPLYVDRFKGQRWGSASLDAMLRGLDDQTAKAPAKTPRKVWCPECEGVGFFWIGTTKTFCLCERGVEETNREREHQRQIARQQIEREQRKAREEAFWQLFVDNYPEDAAFLTGARWSDTSNELRKHIRSGQGLTENGWNRLRTLRAKAEGRDRERAAAREERARVEQASSVPVDLQRIHAMFNHARATGYGGHVRYRAFTVELSKAPDHGANPGALYAKDTNDGAYLGKIVNGVFRPVQAGRERNTGEVLLQIAADPLAAAISYGRLTGHCGCCGRPLTRHGGLSHAGTIGAVCAARFGI